MIVNGILLILAFSSIQAIDFRIESKVVMISWFDHGLACRVSTNIAYNKTLIGLSCGIDGTQNACPAASPNVMRYLFSTKNDSLKLLC